MKVLMISGDPLALQPESGVHKRLLLQAAAVDYLEVFVPAAHAVEVRLGEHGVVRGFTGSKMNVLNAMISAARVLSFDLVTAQDPFFLGLIAWRIARRAQKPLQLQVHTDVFTLAFLRSNFIRYALAQFLLRRADCIRVVSNRVKENLEESGVKALISVLPIFIDALAITAAPAVDLHEQYPQFSKILLTAARLEAEKNIDDIIKAMPEVVRAEPKAGLLIVGEGSERTVLEKLVQSFGLSDHVLFLGYRSDVFSLYKGADLVVAATAPYEGYGASTVEALAAGTPVVSRDVGVAEEAGALIAENGLAETIIQALTTTQGELRLVLPSAEEWALEWKNVLAQCV